MDLLLSSPCKLEYSWWRPFLLSLWLRRQLTVFLCWLVGRATSALVRATPDFWWHPSKGCLGYYPIIFQGFHLSESRILNQQWKVMKTRPAIREIGSYERLILGGMKERDARPGLPPQANNIPLRSGEPEVASATCSAPACSFLG